MNFQVTPGRLLQVAGRIESTGDSVGAASSSITAPGVSCFGEMLAPAASLAFPAATDCGRDFLGALGASVVSSAELLQQTAEDYQETEERVKDSLKLDITIAALREGPSSPMRREHR